MSFERLVGRESEVESVGDKLVARVQVDGSCFNRDMERFVFADHRRESYSRIENEERTDFDWLSEL